MSVKRRTTPEGKPEPPVDPNPQAKPGEPKHAIGRHKRGTGKGASPAPEISTPSDGPT